MWKKWKLLPVLLSLLFTGCWDRTDVDDIAIVVGLGIDKIPKENTILLSAQIVNPADGKSPGSGEGTSFTVITSQGQTFSDAIINFSKSYSKRMIYSHTKIVIMGRDFAKSDFSEALDFLQRDRQFRENLWIFTADKSAKEIIQARMAAENLPASGLDDMMGFLRENAFTVTTQLYDFIYRLKGDVAVSTSPYIKLVNEGKIMNEKLSRATGKQITGTTFEIPEKIEIEETAIYKNNRFIGTIDKNDSRGLLWIRNQLKGGLVVILAQGENQKPISIYITEGNSKITSSVKGRQVFMKIRCEGEAVLRDMGKLNIKATDPEVVKKLEQQTEQILLNRVERVITKATKKFNADFLGFSEHLHNQHPDQWHRIKKDWDEIFPNVEYDIDFKITIQSNGLIKNPTLTKERRD